MIFALTSDDPGDLPLKRSAPCMFFLGVLMVVAQIIIMARLTFSNIVTPCLHSDQCVPGTFCSLGKSAPTCSYCATHAPLEFQYDPVTGDSYNFPEDEGRHLGFNRTHALEVCKDPSKSVNVAPPVGRGNHPGPAGCQCVSYREDGRESGPEPPFDRVVISCGDDDAGNPLPLGEPTPGCYEFVESWCHRCVDPISGDVDPLTGWLLPANNVSI